MLCQSCWIYFIRTRQLDYKKRLKTETCETKQAFLSLKIRRAHQSLKDSVNLTSCEDSEVQFSTIAVNEDNDSNVSEQTVGGDCAESTSSPLNSIESDDESLTSCETAKVITTDIAPVSAILADDELVDATSNNPNESNSESEPPKRKRRVGNVPISASSPENQPTDVTSTDTSDTESEWVPVKRKAPVNVSTSASLQEKKLTELTSDDTSNSESESEPLQTDQVTFADQASWLQKNLINRKASPGVRQLSEEDFTYMDKYPFQATDTSFKCGLCSHMSAFCKERWRLPWGNKIKHIRAWHVGNHKVRVNKVTKRFIEIAPNRFQYGKYKVELLDGKYRCEECGELRAPCTRGSKAANMMEHINSKHENPSKTYVCEHCGKVYRNSFCFSEHKKAKHGNPDGPFPCSECGQTFATRFRTSLHRKQVHGIKKKFICEICGKECKAKHNLLAHIAFNHDGQKFECNECDKVFGSKFSLNIHRHCHLGTKFVCDICGMDFSQQCSVKRHKKTAHAQ